MKTIIKSFVAGFMTCFMLVALGYAAEEIEKQEEAAS